MGTLLYRPSEIPGTGTTLPAATGMTGIDAEARLVVIFQPAAANGDIGALLTSLDAVIVDGPKSDGSFVVQLPTADPDAVSAAMAAMLAKKDLIQSVQRGS
jgi:hypothetical protein